MRAFEGDRQIWAEELENRNVFQLNFAQSKRKHSQRSLNEGFEVHARNIEVGI